MKRRDFAERKRRSEIEEKTTEEKMIRARKINLPVFAISSLSWIIYEFKLEGKY